MTVETEQRTVSYVGDAGVLDHPVPFPFQRSSQLTVHIDDVLQVEDVDYEVSGGGGSTGTVTLLAATTNGTDILISRTCDFLQQTDLEPQLNYSAQTLENALDFLTYLIQQLNDRVAALEAALNLGSLTGGVAGVLATLEAVEPEFDPVTGELTGWLVGGVAATVAVPAGFTASGIVVLKATHSGGGQVVGAVTCTQWTQAGTTVSIEHFTGLEAPEGGATYTLNLVVFGTQA